MSSQLQPFRSARQALVLNSDMMNPSHESHGRRLAEALRFLGFAVDFDNLNGQVGKQYDWCVLTNPSEILFDRVLAGDNTDADFTHQGKQSILAALLRLRPYCRSLTCLLDCNDISCGEYLRRCQSVGIDNLLDFGFVDHSTSLAPSARSLYYFIPNSLTPSEQEGLTYEMNEEERPIPWVFIGHATAHRVSLVNQLITRVDPRGFVFMPNVSKVAAQDSQQFNQRQYETVLRKCRYSIWHSNRRQFRLESERFRSSLLAGSVPIQVVSDDAVMPSLLPFDYLVLRESEAAEKIRQFNFHEIRLRFRADFLAFPSLAEGLAKFLNSQSLLPGADLPIVKSQAA